VRTDAIIPATISLRECRLSEACTAAELRSSGRRQPPCAKLGSKTRARARPIGADAAHTGSVRGLAPGRAATLAQEMVSRNAEAARARRQRHARHPSSGGLASAFVSPSDEAARAFGSGEVYLEKLIERPRHIEIQLLGPARPRRLSCERECSVQRRHQKVLKMRPPAGGGSELRRRMGEAAFRLALERAT